MLSINEHEYVRVPVFNTNINFKLIEFEIKSFLFSCAYIHKCKQNLGDVLELQFYYQFHKCVCFSILNHRQLQKLKKNYKLLLCIFYLKACTQNYAQKYFHPTDSRKH